MDKLRGNGVQIDDTKNALVMILKSDKLADRSEIVSELQIAGRLDA